MPDSTGSAGPRQPEGSSGATPGRKVDLRVRAITSVLLAPLVLGLVWLGGWAFALLVAIAAAILVSEWSGISRGRYVDAVAGFGSGVAGFGSGVAAVSVLAFAADHAGIAVAILSLGAVIAAAAAWTSDPARLFGLGVLYGGLPGLAVVVLRTDTDFGLAAIVWLLVLVWATDIGGYVFGRLLGGPKLASRISPKKTWSGFFGGLVAAVLASVVFDVVALPEASIPIWLAAVLSVVSQAGDLVESAFKRRFGAKDSSRLIPGHGGLMDRIDGLIAAAAVAALVGIARGGMDAAGTGLLVW